MCFYSWRALLGIALLGSSCIAAGNPRHTFASSGTLPLLLTVPHDGDAVIAGAPRRTKGTVVRDAGTRSLAEEVAGLLQEKTGRRPYIVVALVSRAQVDVNRREIDAIEDVNVAGNEKAEKPEYVANTTNAADAYREYHAIVAAYVAEIRSKFPQGALLIDIHGQSEVPTTTFQGSRSGLTVTRLIRRFGASALTGEKSVLAGLARRGYGVNPPLMASGLQEDRRFNGGYTVFTYGSHRDEGIDAIQLEFGRAHRDNPALPLDFADALVTFMQNHGLLEADSSRRVPASKLPAPAGTVSHELK